MKNRYEIRGEITSLYLDRRDGTVLETIIDTLDLPKAMSFAGKWTVDENRGRKFYVRGNIGKGKHIKFHRFLMDVEDDFVVDHIDGDGLNNTRANLRKIKQGQNMQNKNVYKNNKSSGIRGVTWYGSSKKWRARLQVDNKTVLIGLFNSVQEAETAVKAARARYMPYSKEAKNNKIAR